MSISYKHMNNVLSVSLLARYPFLNKARDYISAFNVNIDDLHKPENSEILHEALREIYEVINGISRKNNVDDHVKLMAFPTVLAILSYVGSKLLINKYAVKKAKEIERALRHESNEMLCYIANDGFNWTIKPIEKATFAISFKDYLTASTMFSDQPWKLINQILINGLVYLPKSKLIRLISAEVQRRIMRIELKGKEPPESIRDAILKLRSKIKGTYFEQHDYLEFSKPTDISSFPPCILSIYNDLTSGKPVSHAARFILTTFLMSIGLSVDEVVNIFQRVSDYDPVKTRYQVEHIAGLRGGRTKYTTPKCETIKTLGLCLNNCDVKHPLNMYIRRLRLKNERRNISKDKV